MVSRPHVVRLQATPTTFFGPTRNGVGWTPNGDLDAALAGLGELRAGLPDIDGVALAREPRRDLEQRGA